MKTFLSHPHCRALVRTILHQTAHLALPHHSSILAIFAQIAMLPLGLISPLGSHPLLDGCIDLRRAAWLKAKRRLILAEQRKHAPPELTGGARIIEFLRIPRVKLLLRNGLRGLYTLLFVVVLLLRADMRPLAANAAPTGLRWPLWLEALFAWWTTNLLVDHAFQVALTHMHTCIHMRTCLPACTHAYVPARRPRLPGGPAGGPLDA